MSTANIFSNIPKELEKEFFENIILNEALKVERIISHGHTTPKKKWYDQEQNEWVLILEGEAIILFENDKQVHLKVGDYLNILAHQKHKVLWTLENKKTIWLAIHY